MRAASLAASQPRCLFAANSYPQPSPKCAMRSCLGYYAASRFDALICLLPENYLLNLAITIPSEDESRLRKDAYEGGLPGSEARVRLP